LSLENEHVGKTDFRVNERDPESAARDYSRNFHRTFGILLHTAKLQTALWGQDGVGTFLLEGKGQEIQ
jgi:hypothetical protein